MDKTAYNPGLEGVVAARTRLSSVDGAAGELIIGGFALEEFATRATYEETVFFLWRNRRPEGEDLVEFHTELASRRELSPLTRAVLTGARRLEPMDSIRMAAATVEGRDDMDAILNLTAQMPVIVAAGWRLKQDQQPIAPRPDLGQAANFLWMLDGVEPAPGRVRALETYLNTVVDHGLNASTFTARVITSTGSDVVSAITGAIGALKGPLHGGAPGPALETVFEIGTADRAEAVLRGKLEKGERLMGFGHRIYKVRDPRAEVLSREAERFFAGAGDDSLYTLTKQVESVAVRLLEEYKPGRNLQTNVEFYTALLLHGLGLPVDLFTPAFTIGRLGGWCAHCLEQREVGRIMRPQSEYVGEKGRTWPG